MNKFDPKVFKKLYRPPSNSHKGQNGKLMIIGGSKLFHAASLWSLKVASRIVDMVFYSSISENNQIVQKAKEEFRDGIVVPRDRIDDYINEVDCILIGPGLPREEGQEKGDDDTKGLTEKLLKKYPNKKWVIDGGSLQMMDLEIIPRSSILTPHKGEFEVLKLKIKNEKLKTTIQNLKLEEQVKIFAEEFNCIVLLKGKEDIICSPSECLIVEGGNAGMTKGGTGDVLAGLVAALYCKNQAFLSACAGSSINKKAGDSLYKKVGYYFNASDLVDEIPKAMKKLIL
ncbi:MAG: NAD(P)H-hydrate dehydratase [Candidatus Levybacteria bacterium RIFCSPLOWO2_01_FULL_38_21]|nr:MAG: NAD(P)H-hydrate dehydratase [Candidatus Levybacteria bacterium RIFCSPLOWO2_01_FULL_38_21]